MKCILQALAISLLIHVIYVVGTLSLGFIKTLIYRPDIETAWTQIDALQSSVAFGVTFSSYIIMLSFVCGFLVCWAALFVIQKRRRGFV